MKFLDSIKKKFLRICSACMGQPVGQELYEGVGLVQINI